MDVSALGDAYHPQTLSVGDLAAILAARSASRQLAQQAADAAIAAADAAAAASAATVRTIDPGALDVYV